MPKLHRSIFDVTYTLPQLNTALLYEKGTGGATTNLPYTQH